MSIRFDVDCRDEEIKGTDYWYTPDDNQCGITVHMDSIKIHLTSDQVREMMTEWLAGEEEVKSRLLEHVTGRKEVRDVTQKN